MLERDASYIVRDIARMVGISLPYVHCITPNYYFECLQQFWQIVPHLLTDGQKNQRVKIAKFLLKVSCDTVVEEKEI